MTTRHGPTLSRILRLGAAAQRVAVRSALWGAVRPQARNLAADPPPRGRGAPCRIVSLILAGDEMLLDLIPRRCLRAVSSYAANALFSNVAEKAKGLTPVGHNLERVVRLRPDLVVVASYTDPPFKHLLRTLGIPL